MITQSSSSYLFKAHYPLGNLITVMILSLGGKAFAYHFRVSQIPGSSSLNTKSRIQPPPLQMKNTRYRDAERSLRAMHTVSDRGRVKSALATP